MSETFLYKIRGNGRVLNLSQTVEHILEIVAQGQQSKFIDVYLHLQCIFLFSFSRQKICVCLQRMYDTHICHTITSSNHLSYHQIIVIVTIGIFQVCFVLNSLQDLT